MFLQVVVNQKLLQQDVKNVLCFSGSGATLANGQGFADALRDIYLDELSPELSPAWSLESVTIYDAAAASGTPGQTFIPTLGPIVGVAAGNPLPAQVAALMSFRSAVGPPWVGRTFLAGFVSSAIDSQGVFNLDAVNAMTAWGQRLLTFGADTGIIATHSIIRADDGTPIEDRAAIVTSYQAKSNPSTQRRRKIGVGS